ncbi:MAG: hypothetical protein IPK82_20145 [Polyangiaceae bacterium]|nr:hypothetical protein [Polyangiaceae bacterium]
MLPSDWKLILHDALTETGVTRLPLPARERVARVIAERLNRYGVAPDIHNWGGVLCARTEHDKCCVEMSGRRWQRFPTDAAGAKRLVELCTHATGDIPVEGFRSELRTDGFFGPNDAAERTFQELSAAWTGLEKDFGIEKLKTGLARDSYQAWLTFRDKWKAGHPDVGALGALVADVNLTRQNLGLPKTNIRPPSVTESTNALETLDAMQRAAQAATSALGDGWRAVPVEVKVGAAVAGVAGAVLLVTVGLK